MQFRQNGQRDERRRRVLRDESLTSLTDTDGTSSSGETPEAEPKVASRGYSAAVAVESQPPISCLIASRPWTLSVLVLAGLAVIAGLEAAYANIFHGSGLDSQLTAALDVTARGSLAAWFSSLLLSMAAVNAVLVYWLRSHKLDDYRGRYRVWLWTAMGLVFAAVDASTGLHAVVGHLIAGGFESAWLQNATINGTVVMTLVFGSLGVRLAFEIWASRLARTWAFVAAAGYVVAMLVRVEALLIDSAVLAAMAESATVLVANLAVALMVASYCRYVHLESQGALKPRRQRSAKRTKVADQGSEDDAVEEKRKPAKPSSATKQAAAKQSASAKQATGAKQATESEGTTADKAGQKTAARGPLRTASINSKTVRCDSAHQTGSDSRPGSNAAAAAKSAANVTANVAASADTEDDLEYHPETGEKLSKSERRRLRKQMRRQKKTGSG